MTKEELLKAMAKLLMEYEEATESVVGCYFYELVGLNQRMYEWTGESLHSEPGWTVEKVKQSDLE